MPQQSTIRRGDGHIGTRHFVGSGRGHCLLVPPFGVTASELDVLGLTLASYGFEVTSIDPQDHVGTGSGDIRDFRLSSIVADCVLALHYIEPTCVVAMSLGARAALRSLADLGASTPAVLLTPVVDLGYTLRRVLERDWFAVPRDAIPEFVLVRDVPVRAAPFLRDAEAHDLVGVGDAVADLARTTGPVRLIAGSDDPWVDRNQIDGVVALSDRQRVDLRVVESVHHSLREDVPTARKFQAAALEAITEVHGTDIATPGAATPAHHTAASRPSSPRSEPTSGPGSRGDWPVVPGTDYW